MPDYQLYTDNEKFNREYPGEAKLSEIMASECIDGRARIINQAAVKPGDLNHE